MSLQKQESNTFYVPEYVRRRVERNWKDKTSAGVWENEKVTSLNHTYYEQNRQIVDRKAFSLQTAIIVNSLYRPDQLPIYRMQIALAIYEARQELSYERKMRRHRLKRLPTPINVTVFKRVA